MRLTPRSLGRIGISKSVLAKVFPNVYSKLTEILSLLEIHKDYAIKTRFKTEYNNIAFRVSKLLAFMQEVNVDLFYGFDNQEPNLNVVEGSVEKSFSSLTQVRKILFIALDDLAICHALLKKTVGGTRAGENRSKSLVNPILVDLHFIKTLVKQLIRKIDLLTDPDMHALRVVK